MPIFARVVPGKAMVTKHAAHTTRHRQIRPTGMTRVGDNHLTHRVRAAGRFDGDSEGSPWLNLTGLCRSLLPGAPCLEWHRSHVDPDRVAGNTSPG